MDDYAIEMSGITKELPGITANNNITLQSGKGEIHALLGENGADKSTLMNVLFGLYRSEKGDIKVRGREVRIKGPLDANTLGVGIVRQHFRLVHNFAVLQDIVLDIGTVKHGFLKMDDTGKKAIELSQRCGLCIDLDALAGSVTVDIQQRVETLKMLYRDNEIMTFDEPTAVLTPQEIDELAQIMHGLVIEGKSILFITYKLEEIKTIADRCSVLHRGECIGTVKMDSISKKEMSEMMVGRKMSLAVEKTEAKPDRVVLEAERLPVRFSMEGHTKLLVNDVSFRVQRGEIVCTARVDGNDQAELIRVIVGLGIINAGKVALDGEDVIGKSIHRRNTQGLSHIPEDRHKHGLVPNYNLTCNLVLWQYFEPRFQCCSFLDNKEIYRYADRLVQGSDIRSNRGTGTIARSMSGGDRQRTVMVHEISKKHDILLAIQPTRGLDVGAVEYIHRELVKQRGAGTAILLISLELGEVMNLSGRILAMFGGTVVTGLNPHEVAIQELGLYMAGAKRQNEADKEAHKEADGGVSDT